MKRRLERMLWRLGTPFRNRASRFRRWRALRPPRGWALDDDDWLYRPTHLQHPGQVGYRPNDRCFIGTHDDVETRKTIAAGVYVFAMDRETALELNRNWVTI